jgi:hypothetical protein
MAGQLGIWHAQQLDPGNAIYNIGEYLDIRGALDVDVFETALRHAVSEADTFRVRIIGVGESLRQYVDASND